MINIVSPGANPIGLTMLIVNAPILVLGYRQLGGKRFLVRTLLVVIIYNVGVDALADAFNAELTDDLLLVSLFGGVIMGLGSGLVFRGQGTAAGTGVISKDHPTSNRHSRQSDLSRPRWHRHRRSSHRVRMGTGLVFDHLPLRRGVGDRLCARRSERHPNGDCRHRQAGVARRDCFFDDARWRNGVGGDRSVLHTAHHILFCTVSRAEARRLVEAIQIADPEAFTVIGNAHQRRGGLVKGGTP